MTQTPDIKNSPKAVISRIAEIREAANGFIEHELATRGISGIVPAHGAVFASLFRQTGPVPISTLVHDSGRAKSTVTGIVKTLERHGYIQRQPDPEDARSSLIELTDKGSGIKQDFVEISDRLEARVFGDMAQDDREHLAKLLLQISTNLTA